MRRSVAVLASSLLFAVAAPAHPAELQNDELVLTALRSREAIFRAMNTAASQMQTSGDGNVTEGSWRSGFVRHTEVVQVGRERVSVEFRAVIVARMQGREPDSIKTRFRAEVSADVPIQGADRSSVARIFLMEFVTRANRALTADPAH